MAFKFPFLISVSSGKYKNSIIEDDYFLQMKF